MKFSTFLITCLFLSANFGFAQQASTSAIVVEKAIEQKKQLIENSIVKNVPFENIGPTIMSGRVTDLAVNPNKPSEFYVAYASGGLWHTTNNGTSFDPVLDNSITQNVGDIAVDWKSGTIWVGTGETNSSRSSYAGIGILKSNDNGLTWEHLGLSDSHHISRILINPNNPDEVVVGVTGHLYSPNNERGIYKTTDGGKTWNHTLFIDDTSGIIDLQYAPNNYNIMFASSWTKDRKAWNFKGNGSNSGIYKSLDAGNTWTLVSTPKSGFPNGEGVGRIGLAIYDESTIYAIHDNQFRRPRENVSETPSDELSKDDFKTMSISEFLALENETLDSYLESNDFQEKYRAENVKQMVKSGSVKPEDLAHYLENANSLLFDTPVIGAEVYKSTDSGNTWIKTHEDYLDDIYYSYGYYFGHVYVSPQNQDHIYIYGVPILKSKDGGKTFSSISAENVHSDHHALWINPKDPNHLINGNDGGVNITYDDGEHWIKNNSPSVGQFYAINIDYESPYNVYGGLQDNGVWVGANNALENRSWHQTGRYPWGKIMGGDGMQIEIDNRNSNIVYTGYQFGNYYRINRDTDTTYIQPKHELGENPYRFNWQTPIHLSRHNQDILYLGSNKLMRSMNQGNDWEAISNDLTQGGKKGNVAYGTLTTISESPFQFGLIYTGSDDGLVYITKNAGGSWDNISSTLPENLWVSRVIASKHKKERVYITLNGYRWDDFSVYVYMSEDYGKTWKNISSNIPNSPVNVIKEDPENENILYLGTDNGVYVSFNKGTSWEAFNEGLTSAAVHDIVIQPDAKELLIGTHGRSIYKADIAPLQMMNDSNLNSSIVLFEMDDISHSSKWGSSDGMWYEPLQPKINIPYYSNSSGQLTIKIKSEEGAVLNEINAKADKGFNYSEYDLTLSLSGRSALLNENTSIELNEADNGMYYLPRGYYLIEIDGIETSFIID